MLKRALAMLLCLVMALSVLPMQAFATEVTDAETVVEEVVAEEIAEEAEETAEEVTEEAAEAAAEGTAEESTEAVVEGSVEEPAEATEEEVLQEVEVETETIPTDSWRQEDDRYYFTTFEELKDLLNIKFENAYTFVRFIYENTEDLVITEDITIPEQVSLIVTQVGYEEPATCVVAEGVTVTNKGNWSGYYLTVNGTWINKGGCAIDSELKINGKFRNYNSIFLNVPASLVGAENLSFENDSAYVEKSYIAWSMAEFLEDVETANSLPENWRATLSLQLDKDEVLTESITIPEMSHFSMYATFATDSKATLTLAENCKITLEKGSSWMVGNDLLVNGMIENKGEISHQPQSTITFGKTGSYTGNGKWVVFGQGEQTRTLEEMIIGLDFSPLIITDKGGWWILQSKPNVSTLSKPTSVTVEVNDKVGMAIIRWKAVKNAISYDVYRSTKSKTGFEKVRSTEGLDFIDTTAKIGKKYYYKVKAVAGDVTSGFSATVSATRKCAAPVISVAVSESSGKAKISWEKVTGAAKYYIYRSTSKTKNFEKIGSTTKAYYTDSSAKVGTTYYYKVKAIVDNGNSEYSNRVSAKRLCAQASLKVKKDSTSGKPSLSWSKVEGAKEYKIYRKDAFYDDAKYTCIKTVSSKTTSYKDTKAKAGFVYEYKIKVVGSKSGTDSMMDSPMQMVCTCAKPSISSVSNDKTTGNPVVKWKAVDGALSYVIYRSTSSSKNFVPVGEAFALEGCKFQDWSAKPGKKYYYKVAAIDGNATDSALSSAKSGYAKCAKPMVMIELYNKKPILTWEKVEGAERYEVYRATSKSGKYTKVKTTTSLTYKDTKASKGKTYYYKVVAVASTSSANSAYSSVVSIKSK